MLEYFVIYCTNIEESKDFYESFGFELIKEKHETGPEHYSFNSNGIIFELYPGKVPTKMRIGIKSNKDTELHKLATQASQHNEVLMFIDPDGNKIIIV